MPVIGTPISTEAGKNLGELRELLVKRTGLVHLVGTKASGGDTVVDYTSDNGADSYINEACRWLDTKCRIARQYQITLSAGEYYVSLGAQAISITRVRFGNTGSYLSNKTERYLRDAYGSDFSTQESGAPKYWAFMEDQNADDTGLRLWIMPPVDEANYLYVDGVFREAELVSNLERNWWTRFHWDAVLYVAQAIVLDQDLNDDGNHTLKRLVDDIVRGAISNEVANEVAAQGGVMKA